MDNREAKMILSAYRANGADAADPFFAEALEQVRHDPELDRWFNEQRHFDQTMHQALQSIQPPQQLRERLLVNRRVVQINQPLGWWARLRSRPVAWMAMAASLLLVFTLTWMFYPKSSAPLTTAQLIQEVIDLKESGKISLGKMGGNPDDLRAWLSQQGSPANFTIPSGLTALGGMGCQSFTIHGNKVSLVCFMLDRERMVHFFIVESRALDHPPKAEPSFHRRGRVTVATWSRDGLTYVLLGKDADEQTLRRLI